MADEVEPGVPDDPAGADLPHPDPVTDEDATSGDDVEDHAHGMPEAGDAADAAAVGHGAHDDDHGQAAHVVDDHAPHGHAHDDDHGHDDHGDHGPADDAWVLAPILVGLVVGLIVAVVFGLGSDVVPFV